MLCKTLCNKLSLEINGIEDVNKKSYFPNQLFQSEKSSQEHKVDVRPLKLSPKTENSHSLRALDEKV